MKKTMTLFCILFSSVCLAHDEEFESPAPSLDEYNYRTGLFDIKESEKYSYRTVWVEIVRGRYSSALRVLDEICPQSVEEDIHQELIRIFITIRVNDNRAKEVIMDRVEEDIFLGYVGD